MEPEVHIIEKYFQEVLHCFTMTNIKCKGGREIDILAINPITGKKYHIESSVSTTFKLREKATKKTDGTPRKNGLDYFKKDKFEHSAALTRINELFGESGYQKVLVVHAAEEPSDALIQKALDDYGIHVVLIKDVIADLREEILVHGSRDDIMRLLELIAQEERRSHHLIENLYEQEVKRLGLGKNELMIRLMKLMKIDKRAELFEELKLEKKTSTQILREADERRVKA